MVNDHVKDLRYNMDSHHQGNDSDDEILYGINEDMSIEDWETFYSEDLYNMWSNLREYMAETGSGLYLLQRADYTEFVQFCYDTSSKRMYLTPVGK